MPDSPFGNAGKQQIRERSARSQGNSPQNSPPKSMTAAYLDDVRRNMEKRGRYTPGPGNYEFKSSFAKAASRGKPVGGLAPIRQDQTLLSPGPGSYEAKVNFGTLTQTKPAAPKYTFGSLRKNRNKQGPGPGEYNFSSSFAKAAKRGLPVGGKAKKSETNMPADMLATPGVGTYSSKTNYVKPKAPAYTHGCRRFDPNYYNP